MFTIFSGLICGCGTTFNYSDIGKNNQLRVCQDIPDYLERNDCLNRTNEGYKKIEQEKKYGNN